MSVNENPLPRHLMPKAVSPFAPPEQREQSRLAALEAEITSQRQPRVIESQSTPQQERDDPSLDQLAELLVELKVRPYRDMCEDLKKTIPDKMETPEAIMLWLHDWAEQQLKHETNQGIAYKDYQDGTRDGV